MSSKLKEQKAMQLIAENIYSFPIALPQNPLKWLNCYVIRGLPGERNLLIDTGFHRPECIADLFSGLEELKISPSETDVFLTHLHSDHTGNAAELQARGARIMMSETDHHILHSLESSNRAERVLQEGMPREVLRDVLDHNPGSRYVSAPFDAELFHGDDCISYGGYTLRCLATPGHTPGHLCLYDESHRLIFLGDHILFDITPNICFWPEMEDALGTYLKSLQAVLDLPVDLALPGHRHCGTISMRDRAHELLKHHAARLCEAEEIVKGHPGICGYEVAGAMTWRIRAKNWEEFPPGQKWFAVGEALSHLDHLVLEGRIERFTDEDGHYTYR